MSKTLTLANRREQAKLESALADASSAVYAVALPRRDVPFRDCLRSAPTEIAAAYRAAREARDEWESRMIDEWRGYRGRFGSFVAYPDTRPIVARQGVRP